MSEYRDFSSLPPDKEQQFVVFEKTSVESADKAKKIGMIVSGIFGLVVVIVVFSFSKPKSIMADEDRPAALEKSPEATETKKEEAPKPDPAATTPATTGDSEAAAGDSEAATDDSEAATDDAPSDAPSDGDAEKTDG
jgi:cytoskeletal protein RodZ